MRNVKFIAALGVVFTSAFLLAFTLSGCGGTGGNTSAGQFDSETYTDPTGGNPTPAVYDAVLSVNEQRMAVSEVSGFSVKVTSGNGAAVENAPVVCDTEAGLALIEPNDGTQLSEENGFMSGRVGCAQPGSFRMLCAVGSLTNPQGSVSGATIVCTGATPDGFTGFQGAGGGGLGGGSSNDETPAEINDVFIFDTGAFDSTYGAGDRSLQVDTSQEDCDNTAAFKCENIFDAIIGIDVENGTRKAINFTTFSYRVFNVDGNGGVYQSSTIALSNADEVGPRSSNGPGQKRFLALFARAFGGNAQCVGGGKSFLGSSQAIGNLGFKSIEVKISGTDSSGANVTLTRRVGVSLAPYNRCGGN